MVKKIGRNEPCSCGSINPKTKKRLKYKKCCLINEKQIPTPSEIARIQLEMQRASIKRRKQLIPKGIYIDFPSPATDFKGKTLWAFGSGVYHCPRENMTFHEGLIFVLRYELAKDKSWVSQQESLPLDKRHFIFKCFDSYKKWRVKSSVSKNLIGKETWSAVPDGLTKSLLSLAFDFACIIHVHGHVPEQIVERLKKTDNIYQGARYEIAVGAIFARMGCDLEFLDETLDGLPQTPGHCEFFATDKETGVVVGVEAKSKVRKGVLHQPGQAKDFQLWNNVTGPYRNALKQNPDDIPFFVFVDVNAPPSPGVHILDKPWVKDILESRKKTPLNKPEKPDPCTVIAYTNYSYHYQTNTEAKANEGLVVMPEYPKHSVPESFLHKLQMAVENYNFVPNIGYDNSIQG